MDDGYSDPQPDASQLAHLPLVGPRREVPAPVVDLLHGIGFIYLRHGQARRAAVILMVAGRAAPERVDLLKTLAAALIDAELGERAGEILDRIETLDPMAGAHPMHRLMRARSLDLCGLTDEARRVFAGLGRS